jgi:hypothetical protein
MSPLALLKANACLVMIIWSRRISLVERSRSRFALVFSCVQVMNLFLFLMMTARVDSGRSKPMRDGQDQLLCLIWCDIFVFVSHMGHGVRFYAAVREACRSRHHVQLVPVGCGGAANIMCHRRWMWRRDESIIAEAKKVIGWSCLVSYSVKKISLCSLHSLILLILFCCRVFPFWSHLIRKTSKGMPITMEMRNERVAKLGRHASGVVDDWKSDMW